MNSTSRLSRFATLAYGTACYVMFLGVFLYAIGFIGNFGVPTTLDGPRQGSFTVALLVNGLLLTIFALQHSGMARPTFKKWWTRFVPQPTERSTYVLFSNIAMVLMFWLWQPMGGVVWNVEHGVGRALIFALFASGWLIVLYATCLINHFDLFGMRQVWLHYRNQPCTPLEFHVPSLYRYVRHPLYVGWLTVFWAAPTMTIAHLFFAVATTAYILVAIQLEERNLVEFLPGYAEYRQRVPMLVPSLTKSIEPVVPSPAEGN
jgi:protein-S-isoprenylcysteine O-methyltransferase Ste14